MMIKEELIAKIIDLEWIMFQNVSNAGGRASCQDDRDTFRIMRSSQAASWSQEVLESYWVDLLEAQERKRNLLEEKYARMMKYTYPAEYAAIEDKLTPLDSAEIKLIEDIVEIVMNWESELLIKYPNIVKKGRPLHSTEDTMYATSVETYLRGELSTYSQRTLKLYYQHVIKQKSENLNGSEIVLDNMMKKYGFSSLAEANNKM